MTRSALVIVLTLSGCGGPPNQVAAPDSSMPPDNGHEAAETPDTFLAELESLRINSGIPALAALELRDGSVHRVAAVGTRRSDGDAQVRSDDPWHLASCGKAMTAALLAGIVEDGAIGFDTTLETVFPDLEIESSMRRVTLYQLLVHRGGLPDDRTPTPEIIELLSIAGAPRDARAELARRLLSRPPAVTPDTEMRYSNFGYVLIGAALERVTHTSFEELMQDRLFAPLEMNSCGFGPPAAADEHAPSGHLMSEGALSPVPTFDNPAFLAPAGTVHCSLIDWARFIDWTMTTTSEVLPLSESSYARLRTPTSDGYAPGFMVTRRDWASGPLYTHAGTNGSFFAVVWAIPAERRALFAVTNAATSGAQSAANGAIALMIGAHDD